MEQSWDTGAEVASIDVSISIKETGSGRDNANFSLESDLKGEVSLLDFLRFTKTALLTIASDVLQEEQAKGFDKNPIVVVDGSQNKPVASVNPLGKIEFISSAVTSLEIIESIYLEIFKRSKFVTGTYIQNNYVFYNGTPVANSYTELKTWINSSPKISPTDIIRIVNVVPYARKLERHGVSAQRTKQKHVKSRDQKKRSGETILGANGTYFLASRAALKGFKQNVKIKFEFVVGSTLPPGVFPKTSNAGKSLGTHFKPKKGSGAKVGPYLYPSIKIVIGESGVSDV